MQTKHERLLLTISICFFFFGCKNKSEYGGQDIDFIPVNEFAFKSASIAPGTPVSIIAYSGGKPNTASKVYYYQFIVVNDNTGDTLRILSTMISVGSDIAHKTLSETSLFDPARNILTAAYYPQDSTVNMAINLMNTLAKEEVENKDELEDILSDSNKGTINRRQYVAVNRSMDIFQGEYKTAFGVLHFIDNPW